MQIDGVELLLEHYLEFQRQQGKLVDLKDFAAFCGVNESYFNLIMNRRRPLTKKMAVHLAGILNDPRFYDIFNLPRPDSDPDLEAITRIWPQLTDEERNIILEQIEKFKAANERIVSKPKTVPRTT